MARPRVVEIRGGWLAIGQGWAVRGTSQAGAIAAFKKAERHHLEIDGRPLPGDTPEDSRPTNGAHV